MALMEETLFDERNGRIMNPGLAEYHVPVHLDVPEIDVIWTDIADPHTPMAHTASAKLASPVWERLSPMLSSMRRAGAWRELPITLDKLL